MSFDISLFGDLEPRSSKETDKKTLSKLGSRAKAPSQGRGNTIRDKMEYIKMEVSRHLSFLFDKVESCRSEERLIKFIDNFIQQEFGAIDTETLGKDYFKDKIFGWSANAEGDKSIYVPVEHRGYVTGDKLQNQIDPYFIQHQLERVKKSLVKLVYHNAKFDLHMIYHNYGVMLPVYWDTMIASRMLHSAEQDHSLKGQYNVKIKGEKGKPYDFKSLFEGVAPETVPVDTMTPYAAGDTFETLALMKYQMEEMKKNPGIENAFRNIEMPLLPVVVKMEEDGVAIDREILQTLTEKYTARYSGAIAECYKELDKYADKINVWRVRNRGGKAKLDDPINLSSPAQLAIIMYDIIGLAELPKYKRGTGKEVIKHYKNKNKFVEKLSKVKEVEKLVTGFLKAIPKFIKEDGRVHSDFVQIKGTGNTTEEDEDSGADTGRFSSKDPNLQQIPSKGEGVELRKIFRASDGYILMSSDYSQQEPRILAHCSNDKEMIKAYQDGKDLYALMASKIYRTTYENCLEFYPEGTEIIIDGKKVICGKNEHTNKEGKKRRGDTKSVLLGLMYGRGQASIAEQTGSTQEEAKALIETFYNEFPNIRKWMNKVENDCKRNGYVDTVMGRRRELPDAMLPEYEFKNKGGRPADFNPLNFMENTAEITYEVDDYTKKYYTDKLNKAYGWKAKQDVIEEAKEEGIEIKDNNQFVAKAMRQAVNTIIQGSAADMSKIAMILCAQNEELTRLGYRLLFPVHDEIIAEAPIENAKRCGELMSEMMVEAARIVCPSLPFKCDVSLMKNWGGDEYGFDANGNLIITDKH